MAHEEAAAEPAGKLVIKNIALLLSGDIDQPLLEADTVVCVDGRITAVGKAKDCDTERADTVIDAQGASLAPGLIDSHTHPVFGNWTPRQNQLGWLASRGHAAATRLL